MRSPIQSIVCALALAATAIPASAQVLVPFRVTANLAGAVFWVDGQTYTDSATFHWQQGSQHTVEVRLITRYDANRTTRWIFRNWTDDAGKLINNTDPVQIVTADFGVKSFSAVFAKQHRVDIYVGGDTNSRKNLCHSEDADEVAPRIPTDTPLTTYASWSGFVQDRTCGCLVASTYRWVAEGETMSLQAVPYPGWVFTGFRLQNGTLTSHLSSTVITSPQTLRVVFEPARRHIFRTERLLKYQTTQAVPIPRAERGGRSRSDANAR